MKKIITYKNYFAEFMDKLSELERKKIQRALSLFKAEDKIPSHYIKFIRDGVYEFRVACGNNELRIFFIYDGENVVVLFNCFRKKTQKTPDNEIKKAINLKKEYYKKLSQMTKKERLQYFRDNYCNEQKLNFEKEINGTIYKVNTHFDENAEESILNKFFRLTKKS